MGPFKLLIFAFTATVAAQTASSRSALTHTVRHNQSISSTATPPSTDLPPPLSSTGGMRHEGPSNSASVTVSVVLSTTVVAGMPWPTSGFTVQTSEQTNVTSVAIIPVDIPSSEIEVPAPSFIDTPHSGHQSTIVITATASGATSKAASATGSAPPSKSSSAGLQHGAASVSKVGSMGVALAMLCGVFGA